MKLRIFQKGFNYSQDGPGNRLVYHLQGCNLRCPWCSNPEGLASGGGTEHTAAELADYADSCRMMFFDGGGVTLTGGEVTMQFDAVRELLTLLKERGIHTAIETNGIHRRLPELYPLIDHLIMDCKHYDTEKHRTVTGVSNELTLRNIRAAIESGHSPALRIPLIGGFNADHEDAAGFAALFRELGLPGRGSVELLPYHEYGKEKYARLGMDYTMTDNARVTAEQLAYFTRILRDTGITVIRT